MDAAAGPRRARASWSGARRLLAAAVTPPSCPVLGPLGRCAPGVIGSPRSRPSSCRPLCGSCGASPLPIRCLAVPGPGCRGPGSSCLPGALCVGPRPPGPGLRQRQRLALGPSLGASAPPLGRPPAASGFARSGPAAWGPPSRCAVGGRRPRAPPRGPPAAARGYRPGFALRSSAAGAVPGFARPFRPAPAAGGCAAAAALRLGAAGPAGAPLDLRQRPGAAFGRGVDRSTRRVYTPW